jgi:hypothetical protein
VGLSINSTYIPSGNGLPEALRLFLGNNTIGGQAFHPKRQGALGYREGCLCYLAVSLAAALSAGPREERQNSAGPAMSIAIVEVIGFRIVEINRYLDQAQPQHAAIKIDVLLRIAGDRCDVVNA